MSVRRPRKEAGRRRLVGTASVVALAAAALAGLAALFVRADPRRGLAESSPDTLGVAYLQAFVDSHPADVGMRLRLAREQLALGMYQDAERTLVPIEDGSAPEKEAALLALDVAVAARRSGGAGTPGRASAEAKGLKRLERLLARDLGPAELAHVADVARELGRPDLAARAHELAAGLDRHGCAGWFSEAGRDFLAAGDPRSAAEAYAGGCDCSAAPEEAVPAGLQALDAYLAADMGAEALRFADRLVERFPEEAAVLQRAVEIALGQDDPQRARRFGEGLLAVGPRDPVSLGRQLDLDLAAGDLSGALRVAERLAAQAPDDARSQLAAARVATWAGQPELALRHWMWLARRGDAFDGIERALGLARAIGDGAAVADLLAMRARKGPLPRASLAELADVEERNRDPSAALATRVEIARRFGGGLSDSVGLARLQWTLGRPGDALAELRRWSGSAGSGETEYWELLADLAWEEEDDDAAMNAYRALWENGRIDAAGVERLLILSRAGGRREDVIRYGREGWSRLHQPRFLLFAMDEAARAGRWGELEVMAEEAAGAVDLFAGFPAYWMLRARVDERNRRVPEAVEAYRRALAADPRSSAVRSGVIWLLAGSHDHEALLRCLSAWAADAWNDPALWRAYAAGLKELGRRREALSFYEREAWADPGDAEAVKRLALAAAGDGSGAGPDTADAVTVGSGRFRSPAAAVGVRVGAEAMGPVVLEQQGAVVRSEAWGAEVEARARLTGFTSRDPSLRLPGEETELLVHAAFPALGGRNEAEGGASVRADGNLPRARLVHARDLASFAQARVEGSLDEPADESAALRVEAVRTRLGGALALAGGPIYGRAGFDWKSWSTRAGVLLGTGGAATIEMGWRVPGVDPDLRIRLQGGYQRNQAATASAIDVLSAFAPGAPTILPRELTTAGIGAGAARWPMGPVRLVADAWAGWLWNPARPAFRVQAGLGVAPFGGSELSFSGFAANDRWAGGGNFGVSVELTQSFSR